MVGLIKKSLVNSSNLSFEGNNRQTTYQDKKKIIDMRKQGMNITEIADATGYCRSTITRLLQHAGMSEYNIADEKRTQVVDLYEQGIQNVTEIAKIVHCGVPHVEIILQEAGLKETKMKRLLNKCENGKSIPQKTAELQNSLERMRNVLKEVAKEQILDMYQNQGMTKEEIMLYYIKTINEVLQDAETKED